MYIIINTWLIRTNPAKSVSPIPARLILTKSSTDKYINIFLNYPPVPLTDEASYLGIKLQRHLNLNWSPEIKKNCIKSIKILNVIWCLHGTFKGCHSKTLIHTYKTFMRPIIDYCAVVPSQASAQHLEALLALERRIIRSCLNVNPRYSSSELYHLANLPPRTTRLEDLQKHSTQYVPYLQKNFYPRSQTSRTLTQK